MSNDELILEWDKLYTDKENMEAFQFQEFNKKVQDSYNNNEITWKDCCKFAALMCYLGTDNH